MIRVRPPAVAGMFYPADAGILQSDVAAMLAAAPQEPPACPKALIVPHAGYIYSGPVAASAYACLAPWRDTIRRVVLFGPAHRLAVHGLALPGVDAFDTPLGRVPIDTAAPALVGKLPGVVESPQVHALEHSLEVQLPFLQAVLTDFTLLPFAVGLASAEQVAVLMETLWGGEETLLVVSSDLSHYHPYRDAQRIDRGTTQAILALDPAIDHEQACGATPIAGLLLAARRRHLAPELLDLRNSGDTAGERSRVVGYAAFAFFPELERVAIH